ncbi:MAG: DUF3106 domain-containing protein [Candidatus Omnitrophica bacterium]|nr:DUF3106 domain-containing protein [Candidatus Omnitrophota bacterium]
MRIKKSSQGLGNFILGIVISGVMGLGSVQWVYAQSLEETQGSAAVRTQDVERWNSLSSEEKEQLRQRYRQLQGMEPARKKKILEKYGKFKNLDPQKRQQLKDRWQQFKNLPPERRQALREKFQKWNNLPPEKKERLKALHQKIYQMPEGRRAAFKEKQRKWESLSPEKRQNLRQKFREQGKINSEGSFKKSSPPRGPKAGGGSHRKAR